MHPWEEPHPRQSTRLKIRWAEKHLDTIDSYIPKYKALNPVGVVYDLNADKTFYEGRLNARFPPFLDFGVEIGEFAYQLRSALDNLVYALSSANFPGEFGSTEREQAEKVPFFNISRIQNDSAIRGGIKFVADEIREEVFAAIDKHQPYKRGDRADFHQLSMLDELNVRDKHRIVNAAASNITIDNGSLPEGIEVMGGRADHGDVIVRIPAHLDPERDFSPRLSFQIILRVGRPAGGIDLAWLRGIHDYVRDILIPDFVQFFPPEP